MTSSFLGVTCHLLKAKRYQLHTFVGLLKDVILKMQLLKATLNRGIKGTEKLKGPFKQNCTYLEHDVQPLHTSITIDAPTHFNNY